MNNNHLALIENFLLNGGPSQPETRATKHDLLNEIKKRDQLLIAIRVVMLNMYAKEIARNTEGSP
jgi:hypothetical protein